MVQSWAAPGWDFSIILQFFKANERKKKKRAWEGNIFILTRFVSFIVYLAHILWRPKYDVTNTFRKPLKSKIMSKHYSALWLNVWKCTDFKRSCMEFDLGTNDGVSLPPFWPVPFQTICRFNLRCISIYRGKVLQLYLSVESQQSQLTRCSLLI